MTEEVWAQIPDFPDYAISDLGNVKNLKFDRPLHPRENSYGSQRVVLMRDGERHELYVHHIVAAVFVTGYVPGTRIKHRDDNNSNNDVTNFRFTNGRGLGQRAKNLIPPTYRRVRIVETGEVFRTVENCARHLGGDPSSIYRVLRGDRLSHKGYTFEYVEETE